jgi:hypothetical protein
VSACEKARSLERELVGIRIDGFFPTPLGLARHMVRLAGIRAGDRVLEPSAGAGAIADEVRVQHPDAVLSVVETVPRLRRVLEAKGHVPAGSDFLRHEGEYDVILMNPPFERGLDATHVRRAAGLLAPGGRLVAVMCEGPFFRGDAASSGFREWADEVGAVSVRLPHGTFDRGDRPTGVQTRLLAIGVPEADERLAISLEEIRDDSRRAAQRATDPEPERSYIDPVAKRLARAARGMRRAIDARRASAQPSQRLTPRRARMAGSAEREAWRQEGIQALLYALADSHEAGGTPEAIAGIRTRSDVEAVLSSSYPFPRVWTRNLATLVRIAEASGVAGEERSEVLRLLASAGDEVVMVSGKAAAAAIALARYAKGADKGTAEMVLGALGRYSRMRSLGLWDDVDHKAAREALLAIGGAS